MNAVPANGQSTGPQSAQVTHMGFETPNNRVDVFMSVDLSAALAAVKELFCKSELQGYTIKQVEPSTVSVRAPLSLEPVGMAVLTVLSEGRALSVPG